TAAVGGRLSRGQLSPRRFAVPARSARYSVAVEGVKRASPPDRTCAVAIPATFVIVGGDRPGFPVGATARVSPFCSPGACSRPGPAHKDVFMTLQVLYSPPLSPTSEADDRLDYARQIIRAEAAALDLVAQRLDGAFLQAVELIQSCPGRLAITGTGK